MLIEFLTTLDWLAAEFETQGQRLAVTVAAMGAVLLVLLSHRNLQAWLTTRTKPLYADIITTVVLLGVSFLSLLVTIGVWGVREELQDVFEQTGLGAEVVVQISITFVVFVITYIVWRFLKRLLHDIIASSASITSHQEEVSHRVIQVVLWSFAIVFVLGIWVDDLGGLLVGAGFLGIVVGMAARQTLGTILAGFVLMFSQSFEVGHWIEIDGREGTVTEFSIFNTQLQSFDGEYISIPNDVVTSSIVTNRSRKGRIRVEVDVGVDYSTDVEQAATLARDALEGVEQAMDVPEPQVVTKQFGDSAVLLGVRFWIDRPSSRRKWAAKTAAIRAIKSQFEAADVKIPFPQRELTGRAEADGFRITAGSDGETPESGQDDDSSTSVGEHDGDAQGMPSSAGDATSTAPSQPEDE